MRNLKSHTPFFLGLYNVLLTQDMVRHYGEPSLFARDFQTIENRVENEGTPFLTNTLPIFAKAIDTALVNGRLTPPLHFSLMRGTLIPNFLRVLTSRVFEQDGTVKIDPCISAVRDLRQILYLLYKYEEPYKEEVINDFIDKFRRTDVELGWAHFVGRHFSTHLCVLEVARTLLSDLLRDYVSDDIVPSHGPGAVASGQKNWEKMKFAVKYDCIHQRFPYYNFFVANAMDLAATVRMYKDRPVSPSGVAKTVLVPKDARGPRLISMEPTEFMWIQQGIMKKLVDWIEHHPLTRGHVNFTDQEINRSLALQGSISGDCVTLDMKEASDRISLWLVRMLFADLPLLDDILATRTEATELPSGEVHLMRKFAPMGSALCFPIMSLVHWSLAVATLYVYEGVPLKQGRASVYVYGDDIIIKGQNHTALFDVFPRFELQFNEGKCCTTGIFRESCGMDAVMGQEVTPLKLKKQLPVSPYDATGYVAYVDYINSLWSAAYYSSSDYIKDYIEEIFGVIPSVSLDSDAPGLKVERAEYSNARKFHRRWNKKLQRYEYKVKKIRGKKHCTPMDRCEYQRKLMNKSLEFKAGVYSVPRRVNIKQGWSARLI